MRPSIVIGPGERLQPLAGILSGLGWSVRPLHDWADLGPLELEGPFVVLVDAESTPHEDLGFLRRCLDKNPSASATATGEDARARVARSLLAMPRVRWMGWPPDLNDILALTARPDAEARAEPRSPAATTTAMPSARNADARALPTGRADGRAGRAAERDEENARIQSILEGELDIEPAAATAPLASARSRAPEPIAQAARDVEPRPAASGAASSGTASSATASSPAASTASDATPSAAAPPAATSSAATSSTGASARPAPRAHETVPTWWRAQVADLADAAQRIELGAQAVRSETLSSDAAEQVDALENEIARLVQFARTLGYVAAPPGRGEQQFDLSEMVQVFVTELANRPDTAPRCLFRAPAHVWVRSDRILLGQVFDALFWLAGACARSGELVRAQVRREGDIAEARIEFPAGPLESIELERILEPYGLRRLLPDLGPNALSAAQGILAGQGGRVELARTGNSRLEWRIELPAVDSNGGEPSPPPGGKTKRGGNALSRDQQ